MIHCDPGPPSQARRRPRAPPPRLRTYWCVGLWCSWLAVLGWPSLEALRVRSPSAFLACCAWLALAALLARCPSVFLACCTLQALAALLVLVRCYALFLIFCIPKFDWPLLPCYSVVLRCSTQFSVPGLLGLAGSRCPGSAMPCTSTVSHFELAASWGGPTCLHRNIDRHGNNWLSAMEYGTLSNVAAWVVCPATQMGPVTARVS